MILSVLGLLALGVSLIKANGAGGKGSTVAILVWLAVTAAIALGVLAAGQGTMNNLTFGNRRYQYYESICGGAGAGQQRFAPR